MQRKETFQEHIYKDILARIYEGELPDSTSLPTLEELCRQYQAGDNCVRAAIGRLRDNGYLSTKRGRPARVIYHPSQQEPAGQELPAPPRREGEAHPFHEAIHILFPSIFTYASLACTETQLEELRRIISISPYAENERSDYNGLNISFFKAVLSSVQNDLIQYIVRAVMQSTVLPAILAQRGGALEEETQRSAAAMRRIYAAILEKDPVLIKGQWKLLFEIAESVVQATAPSSHDVPVKGDIGPDGLQYADEFKYMLIAHDLYEKILEGEYPVGTFLPTIAEARRIYRAAKGTIQTAYRVLSNLEIIQTIHGRGSKVIRLAFASTSAFDGEALQARKHEYLEAIGFLQVVCEDIILRARSQQFQALKNSMESGLNPSHQYSALILCRFLMKDACSRALDTFFQVISRRLYWGTYFNGASGGITSEEKHCQCMGIVDALERQQTDLAVFRTKALLAALYLKARQ